MLTTPHQASPSSSRKKKLACASQTKSRRSAKTAKSGSLCPIDQLLLSASFACGRFFFHRYFSHVYKSSRGVIPRLVTINHSNLTVTHSHEHDWNDKGRRIKHVSSSPIKQKYACTIRIQKSLHLHFSRPCIHLSNPYMRTYQPRSNLVTHFFCHPHEQEKEAGIAEQQKPLTVEKKNERHRYANPNRHRYAPPQASASTPPTLLTSISNMPLTFHAS